MPGRQPSSDRCASGCCGSAGGRFRIGTPDEVLRADVLSDLYGTPVDVVRTMGRIVIVGGNEPHDQTGAHHHCDPDPHATVPDEGRI